MAFDGNITIHAEEVDVYQKLNVCKLHLKTKNKIPCEKGKYTL